MERKKIVFIDVVGLVFAFTLYVGLWFVLGFFLFFSGVSVYP